MNFVSRNERRRGASLIEVAMSSLLVGVLLISALNTVGARLRHQHQLIERQRAALLAEQLAAEVLTRSYQDPDESPVFGPEGSETAGTRDQFDDVDDFHGWDATPPQSPDGTPLANSTGWRRTASVEYVQKNDLRATTATDEGFKRITVMVYRDGKLLATNITVRSGAWEPSL